MTEWRRAFIYRLLGLLVAQVGFCLGSSILAHPAEEGTGEPCVHATVVSVPSRPTVSNGADTTQCGVVEAEYGYERQWPGGGDHLDDLSGGLRIGITANLDFHWSSGYFWNVVDQTRPRAAFGDTWLGLKYHFLAQRRLRPGMGIFYQAKVPSAGAVLGTGTGQVDHAGAFLVSKDISRLHFDFNAVPLLAGRKRGPGMDHNTGLALSCSLPLSHRLGVVAEGYGYTFLNPDSPSFASTMAGFTYQWSPRFVLDAGVDVGVTAGAPPKRVFAGATYALGDLFGWLRTHR